MAKETETLDMKSVLMQTAMDLFRSKGFENTSIVEICDKAGVTRTAFYYYYVSKDDLLTSYFKYSISLKDNFLGELIKKPNDWEKLIYIFEAHIKLFVKEGKDFTRQVLKSSIENRKGLLDKYELTLTLCVPLIEQCQKAGYITSKLEPRDINYFSTHLCMGIVLDWSISDKEYDVAERAMSALYDFLSRE